MTRIVFAAAFAVATLAAPAVFAADSPPRPWQQVAQERAALDAQQPPRWEWMHMYDRHQNYAGHWMQVR